VATQPRRQDKTPEHTTTEHTTRGHTTRGHTPPEALDLSRYERPREEPDDFGHRMLANIAAFAFTIALMAIGIWLVISITDLRKTQDCVLMGRRDCVRISIP
jgi:hypothetical protein